MIHVSKWENARSSAPSQEKPSSPAPGFLLPVRLPVRRGTLQLSRSRRGFSSPQPATLCDPGRAPYDFPQFHLPEDGVRPCRARARPHGIAPASPPLPFASPGCPPAKSEVPRAPSLGSSQNSGKHAVTFVGLREDVIKDTVEQSEAWECLAWGSWEVPPCSSVDVFTYLEAP